MAVFYAVVQYLVTGMGITLVISSIAILIFVLVTVYLVLRYRLENLEHV